MSEALTRGHHPYSPSSLQAREASEYWENRQGETSQASLDGTAQHDAAEQDIHLDDPALTDTQAEAVAQCKMYRERIKSRYTKGCQVISEVYLPIDDEIIVDDKGVKWQGTTGGFLDCGIVGEVLRVPEGQDPDNTIIGHWELEADILDWKFGAWSVEPAHNNLQGMAYLLGLFKKFPKLKRVTVHFVMPHRDEIDFHTFEAAEFPLLYTRVVAVVRRAEAAKKKKKAEGNKALLGCTPTTASCLFCGNIGACPLIAGFALKVGKKYAPVKLPDTFDVTLISEDPTQAKHSMELSGLMQAWAKGVRSQITDKAIVDENWIPEGYTLRSKSDRDIVDQEKFINTAVNDFGVPREAIEAVKTLPLTPIAKLIRDTAPRGQKEKKEEEFSQATIANGSVERGQPYTFLERLRS